ncbi:MAG: ABC transporter permease [Clostridioides sp.]|jgi:putative ABC transport system permease protein|nr:ABC transporter permease [Clostridioides sp.]
MKNVLAKDIWRDIRKSIGRFLSILCIVALGVAFFSGIKVTPLVMRGTTDKYYDDCNLMDVRVLSTMGITDSDVDAMAKVNGVEGVSPEYSKDLLTDYKEQELVFRVHSIDASSASDKGKNYVNRVKLLDGRLPSGPNECVVGSISHYEEDFKLGTKFKLKSPNSDPISDTLKESEFTVVGKVDTPMYLSYDRIDSDVGKGTLDAYIMVPKEDFNMEVYTDAYLTVNGAKELDTYTDEYEGKVDEVKDKIEDISGARIDLRYAEVQKKANDELDKNKKEYEDKKKEAEDKLATADKEIKDGEEKIISGEKKLNTVKEDTKRQIKEGKEKIAKGESDLKAGYKKYEEAKAQFDATSGSAQSQIDSAKGRLQSAKEQIERLRSSISSLEERLKDDTLSEEERAGLNAQISELKQTLSQAQSQYDEGKSELDSKEAQFVGTKNKLAETKNTLDSNSAKLASEKKKLVNAQVKADDEFAKAEKELKDSKEKIKEGKAEFIKAKQEADDEFAKADKKIKDAEDEINKLKKPEWYILDRNTIKPYVEYSQAATNIGALAGIFPVFFFAVAALVSLTTMTRMVDEQRINIGTLKALGYSSWKIAQKYIIYALSASLIGSVAGIAIGYTVFPTIIYNSYQMMFVVPDSELVFDWPTAIAVTAVSILITTMAAFLSCKKELSEQPSTLMLPKAPKNGKRIVLEKIPFIWDKIGFIGKVTVRNLFRYKKRFLMTVLGIAGCSALILTGFGIKDSIKMIVTEQFGSIFKYDTLITLDNDPKPSELEKMRVYMSSDKKISSFEFANEQNGKIAYKSKDMDISLEVPEDTQRMKKFIALKDRVSQAPIEVKDDGIVLTEKAAKKLGVRAGDTVELTNGKDKVANAKVTGITENYVSHHVYMSEKYYEELYGRRATYNRVYSDMSNTSKESENALSEELIEKLDVKGIVYSAEIKKEFSNTVNNLNYVVLIMIVSAGSLAFVVLYNLTNVNISERIREIATIKVLGFFDAEVSAYIYRENIILTVLGAFLGLGIGRVLHRFIMVTLEVENLMFGRIISPKSYVLSVVVTLVLGAVVNFAMYFKLKNVKMVESLKSVE